MNANHDRPPPTSHNAVEKPATVEPPPAGKKRPSRLGRAGCALILVCWFMLLLSPCALLYLAANQEIRFWHADIPDPLAHPLLLISLVSEPEDRGLRFEASYSVNARGEDLSQCVQTHVRFLLWQTKMGNHDVSYCDCYRREDVESAWTLEHTTSGSCVAAQ